MAIALTSEQLALAESVGQWAKRANTISSVRDLETRGGRSGEEPWASANWHGLVQAGVFAITVPESAGGAGGGVVDVAVAAEQLAATLAPGPVLPTLLAGLVLPAGHPVLDQLGAGAGSVAMPLRTGGLTGVESPGGGLSVTGTASLVLGAGDTTHVLLAAQTDTGETWFLLGPDQPQVNIAPRSPVDFSRALGDVTLAEYHVPPAQLLDLRPGLAGDLAATLAAAEASGIAAWCVSTAADYAKVRQQFGRPIGSFQAIKHLCAGMLGRSEQATALAWDAACAADQAPDELPLAAAAAAAIALDAAVDNAKDAIQVLGGIGFTWEHDAHLYLRRALALRQLLGGSAIWRAQTAELALAGGRRHRTGPEVPKARGARGVVPPQAGAESDQAAEVRRAAALVAKALSAVPPERVRKGLAEVGYVAPAWPKPYGLGASASDVRIIDEELGAAGITRPDLAIGNWAVPAIAAHGTKEQLERFAEPTLRGDITWCQLFSEPEAGLRSGFAADQGGEDRQWLEADRAEGVDLARAPGRLGHLPGSDRP